MLTITPKASAKLAELLTQQGDPELGIRLSIVGGGCSGFQYDMGFDKPREEDEIIVLNGVKLLVDPISFRYLKGIEIDFVETLQGAGFAFHNPNAVRTCGCGKSFAV
jgi:iron-sulfur cluster assembly accessory protein